MSPERNLYNVPTCRAAWHTNYLRHERLCGLNQSKFLYAFADWHRSAYEQDLNYRTREAACNFVAIFRDVLGTGAGPPDRHLPTI